MDITTVTAFFNIYDDHDDPCRFCHGMTESYNIHECIWDEEQIILDDSTLILTETKGWKVYPDGEVELLS